MERLGTITFQANDKMDIFHVAEVYEHGIDPSSEVLLNIADLQFESDKAWVTGMVPKFKAVLVNGDTATIKAWFKGERFDDKFSISIYLEVEEAEELQSVLTEKAINEDDKSDLEPQELHL